MTLRKEDVAKEYRRFSGRVMFPSSHDIFDIPEFEEATFTILSKLLKNKNNVLIATKPRLNVIKHIDESFSNNKKNIQFRFTITSQQDNLLKFWEPNAPRFRERMESLRFAFQKGYKTSVSIEPFLDYNPVELVELVEPFTTESIWLGKMNYIPRKNILLIERKYYDNIRKNYEIKHLWDIYFQLKDNPLIRFKDSIRTKLGIVED
jgi:DNA repair photolyase